MKSHRLILILLTFVFALLLQAASRTIAQPGMVAKGVVSKQADGSLLVDTTPCSGAADKRYIVFKPDFRVAGSNSIQCPGNSHAYSQSVVYQEQYRQ